jgi:acyl carrier protein phosphodiesterase
MNYLGHAFLSFGDAAVLTGNMIGDHVKGKLALEQYPEGIRKGIILHRRIDAFADTHPAIQRAKVWFRPDYGLYAGALLDTLLDHYLAGDARYFSPEEELRRFSQDTYRKLSANEQYFPPAFARYFPYMKAHDWLYSYRTPRGMQQALQGLSRRAAHMPAPDEAYRIFVSRYYELNQCYYEFIDDAMDYVKTLLTS